jgi:hypothetical protein
VILQQLVPLGGASGVAGAGSASFPLPINLPALPFLAGYQVFAQYVVIDFSNGAPAVTPGVEIELTMPPQVFVGTSVGGSTDPHWFVDAAPAPANVAPTNSTFTDNVGEAVFADGGTNLYVASSITSRVNRADLTGPTPVWSTLFTFASGAVYGPANRRRSPHPLGDRRSGKRSTRIDRHRHQSREPDLWASDLLDVGIRQSGREYRALGAFPRTGTSPSFRGSFRRASSSSIPIRRVRRF